MTSVPEEVITNLVLEKLKTSWSAPALTLKQIQQRQEIVRANALWADVLRAFRVQKEVLVTEIAAKEKTGEKFVEQPFQFLDLSGEIRNMIYDMSIANDEQARESWSRAKDPPIYVERRRHYGCCRSRSELVIIEQTKCARKHRDLLPTSNQSEYEGKLRRLLNRAAKSRLQRAEMEGLLTPGCREAFERYNLEHNMYTRHCSHESHNELNDERSAITINARRDLCKDLPTLSLVNRQIFHDTFYLYFSTKREVLWFQLTIRNLDFFPFLRFCETFTTGDWRPEVRPYEMRVIYDDTDEGKDKVLHTRKFENVKRLIELH